MIAEDHSGSEFQAFAVFLFVAIRELRTRIEQLLEGGYRLWVLDDANRVYDNKSGIIGYTINPLVTDPSTNNTWFIVDTF